MRKSLFLGLAVFAGASCGARSARAEGVRLEYHGPPSSPSSPSGCPREEEAFVTLRAGLPATLDDAAPGVARVDVVAEGDRYVGKLTLHARELTLSRELASASCSDLLRAVSFVLGVAYRETTGPAPAPSTSWEADAAAPKDPAVVAAPVATSRRADDGSARELPKNAPRIELGLAARASALWGVTPGASPRFDGFLELGVNRDAILSPSFRAGAGYSTSSIDVDGGRASFSVLTGAASACPIRIGGSSHKMALVPCARFELGDLHGEGAGIPAARDRHTLWAAAGVELTARWMLSSTMGLELSTAVLMPFQRQAYVIDPNRVIHETGGVAFNGGAGVFFSAL